MGGKQSGLADGLRPGPDGKLRLRFAKRGKAVYISHLDLMRTMQRVFLRAGYALRYSEGFNPHPRISILLPLSVGCSSVCELMDFQLVPEGERGADSQPPLHELPRRLTAVMPEGLTALEVYGGGRKAKELKWLRIGGRLEYDTRAPEACCAPLREFFSAAQLVIHRKTKRGEGESDIAPALRDLSFFPGEDCVRLRGFVSAQEPTLNPELLVQALRQKMPELAPDFAEFVRLEAFDETGRRFR